MEQTDRHYRGWGQQTEKRMEYRLLEPVWYVLIRVAVILDV